MKLPRWISRAECAALLLVLLVAVAWRLLFLRTGLAVPDGDEAVIGIMAQRILAGEGYIYYAGQHYLGSLEAYLAALTFWLFGAQTMAALKGVTLLLSVAFVMSTWALARCFFANRAVAVLAALFAAASPPLFTLWSIKPCGFMTTLILGHLTLIAAKLAADAAEEDSPRFERRLLTLAALMGFGLYQYLMILPYYATALLLLASSPARGRFVKSLGGAKWWPLHVLLAAALGLLVLRGSSDWGVALLSRAAYRAICVFWLAAGVALLAWDRALRRRGGERRPLFCAKWLLAFSLGYLPAIVHAALNDDLWFRAHTAGLHQFVDNLQLDLFFSLHRLVGALDDAGYWAAHEGFTTSYLSPWAVAAHAGLLTVWLVLMVAAACRRRESAADKAERRGVTTLLLHVAFAYVIFCLSALSGEHVRHLLPAYTTIFILLGLFVTQLWRIARPAAVVYALVLLAAAGVYNFRYRFDTYAPGTLTRRDVPALAAWVRSARIHEIYYYDYNGCHLLQLMLGPEFSLGPALHRRRFEDAWTRLQESKNFAYIGIPENTGFAITSGEMDAALAQRDIQAKRERVGGKTVYWNFRHAAQPLTFRELQDTMQRKL